MDSKTNAMNNLRISKTWNSLLGESKQGDDEYINLDNYAFRMALLMKLRTQNPSNESTTSLLKRLNDYIDSKSNINAYLQRERDNFDKNVRPTRSVNCIEILDVSNTSLVKENSSNVACVLEITKEAQQPSHLEKNENVENTLRK